MGTTKNCLDCGKEIFKILLSKNGLCFKCLDKSLNINAICNDCSIQLNEDERICINGKLFCPKCKLRVI